MSTVGPKKIKKTRKGEWLNVQRHQGDKKKAGLNTVKDDISTESSTKIVNAKIKSLKKLGQTKQARTSTFI